MTSPWLNSIRCPRCSFTVSWPVALGVEGKAELAAFAREDRVSAIKKMRDDFDLSLHDAKGLGFHINRAGDVCIRCNNVVAKGETVCANCKSANLNW